MKQETGEINNPIKIKEEVQETVPTHGNDDSDCMASVVKFQEEINDLIKIKGEVQETLTTHDFNKSDCIVSDDKKVIYNLVSIKEELDPFAADDYNQIGGKPLKEESTQEDSNEEITAKPKQNVSSWIISMNKKQIQNELRKLGLDTPRTVAKCRTVLRNYLMSKSVNQKEQNFEVEAEKNFVLPLVPDGQQLLQPAEEVQVILPDLLAASSSSQNDSKMCKSKQLSSGKGSASASYMEVTKQEPLDFQLVTRLSISDKNSITDDINLKTTTKESGSKSKAAKERMTRLTTEYCETSDSSRLVVSSQKLDSGRLQLNNNSPCSSLESVSVDFNIMKLNKNESGSICPQSINLNSNVKLTKNCSEPSDCGSDNNGKLESSFISNKLTDANTFNTDTREKSLVNNIERVYFNCKLCGRKFDRKATLRKHEESNCGSFKLFGCNICGKGFSHKWSIMDHVRKVHSSKKSEKFNCDLCDKAYFSKSGLGRHKNIYHFSKTYSELLPQTCEYCQKTYASKRHLDVHVIRAHRRSEMKQFECAHCSRVFSYKDHLTRHMVLKHILDKTKCALCNKAFCSVESLRYHLQYNKCRTNRFSCEQCGKCFKSKLTLINHNLVHTGVKPFQCQTCGKCFKTEAYLYKHAEMHSNVPQKRNTLRVNRRKSTSAKKKSRRSNVYSETPVNPKPAASHQVFDGEQKEFISNSHTTNIEQLSVDLEMEIKKNDCSVKNEMICLKSKKSNLNNSVDDSGAESANLESALISKEDIEANSFETDKSKDVPSIISEGLYCKNILNNNVASKSERVYFNCNLCERKFERKAKLRKHKQSKCGSSKLIGCKICGKGFLHKSSMMDHVNKDHGSKKPEQFNCDLCSKVYCTKQGLIRHKDIYHFSKTSSDMLPQTCEYCQKIYASQRHLKAHVVRKHLGSEVEKFECAHCSQVFTYKYGIISHMRSMHLQTQVKCVFCNHCFSCEKSLQDHIKSNMCRAKRFICEQCGKVLKSKYSLTNHLLTHTDEKPFVCGVCGKSFKSESNLSQHSVTHSDIRPFICDVCGKSFRIRNHLRQHMGVHGLVNTVVKRRQISEKRGSRIKK